MMKRKQRADRNHVIYMISCKNTGDFYIGLTVSVGRAFRKSAEVRFMKHRSAAKCDGKDWTFSEFLRANPAADYSVDVLDVIRGRKAAHELERALIAGFEPTLNTK